jgi:hypothetical protein
MAANSSYALMGRIGAYRLHATHDPKETTKAARAAFNSRFYLGIPEGLPADERVKSHDVCNNVTSRLID